MTDIQNTQQHLNDNVSNIYVDNQPNNNNINNVLVVNNQNNPNQIQNQNQNQIQNQNPNQRYTISYERNERVILMVGSISEAKNNKIKEKPNNYSLVNVDDPELFDGKIKCARLKCIVFGFLTFFINLFRLGYLLFLHLGYPLIIWVARFLYCMCCFVCVCCQKDVNYYEPETKRNWIGKIGEEGKSCYRALELVKNCAKAFANFIVNFFKCPCWFFNLIKDCFIDIQNRALDNARIGCYKYIHNDCGLYSKFIEDPFNNYNKKRHIILETDYNDPSVIYGEACKNNIMI